MVFQKNIAKSFKKVKQDIENIQNQISKLKQAQEDISKVILRKEKKRKL